MKRKVIILILAASGILFTCEVAGRRVEGNGRAAPVRRALLIGISKYNNLGTNRRFKGLPWITNDVRAMEQLLASPAYGFEIKKLEDSDATRQAILEGIKDFLIDQAGPGDVSLLYFSGHGSRVVNSLGGESDGMDETLVPFDVVRPVKERTDLKDIRDKELNELLYLAATKGIRITAIIDSCHSGSISRGSELSKQFVEEEFDIQVPPNDRQKEDPVAHGALVLSAARDFQTASAAPYGYHPLFSKAGFQDHDSLSHFTANLLLTLYSSPASTLTAGDLFRRVEGRMRADGIAQRPEIEGDTRRRKETLFGEPIGSVQDSYPVEKSANGEAFLLGGIANGFTPGSDLVLADSKGNEDRAEPLRIRLTNVQLTKSNFKVISSHSVSEIDPGAAFKQVTWAPAPGSILEVWIPPTSFSLKELRQIDRQVRRFARSPRVSLVESRSGNAELHILRYAGSSNSFHWELELPSGRVESLRRDLSFTKLESLLIKDDREGPVALYVEYPPPTEIVEGLSYSRNTLSAPIIEVDDKAAATYVLEGRSRESLGKSSIEYSWTLASRSERKSLAGRQAGALEPDSLPAETDWFSADMSETAAQLHKMATRLARLSGWLKVSPPSGAEVKFPYRLRIGTESGTTITEKDPLVIGQCYRLFLEADPNVLDVNFGLFYTRFSVYVISIDKLGNMSLLGADTDEQIFTGTNPPKSSIELTTTWRMKMKGEPGAENYVFLFTREPLPDKAVLVSSGVKTEGTKAGSDPLSLLLNGLTDPDNARTTRSGLATPDDWFVDRLTMFSINEGDRTDAQPSKCPG